jgi:DNA-binding beta-propeller fold protein YncE
VLAAAAAAVTGCGSETVHELPAAAEPARAPALTAAPAGRVVAVGRAPEGLAADPATHTFAVALRDPDQLALVDARSGRVRDRVVLPGGPRHLTTDLASSAFVVPAETAGRALTVTPTGRVTADVAVGDHPHDATALAGRTFVGNESGNTVSVLDGDRETARFAVATQPGGLAAAEGGHALAVVSVRERVLELYDPRTLKRIARVPAGVGPTHVVAVSDRLYVTDTRGGALLVFATRPELALVRRVYLPGGPYGIAHDPVRHRLWVTLTARNEVVSLPANGRPRPLVRLPTVRQPDSVAVDPSLGTLAVTGRDAGVLQLIDVRGAG